MNKAAARNKTLITVGLDLGDRRHTYYVLDEAGKMAREEVWAIRASNWQPWHEVIPAPLR
jgi:hypothetical protein